MTKKESIIIKRYLIVIICVISSFFFWEISNIDSIIYNQGDGVSDLSRYYKDFNNITSETAISVSLDKDFLYSWITVFFKSIGVNFNFFLFFIIILAYYVYSNVYVQISNSYNFPPILLLLLFASFWMGPLFTVALRQGLIFLILIYFFFSKSYINNQVKIIGLIFAIGVHFSAILFIPFLLIEKYFTNRIKQLDLLFIITFILYCFDNLTFLSEIIMHFSKILNIDIRALGNEGKNYNTGFSFFKAIAIILPALIFRLSKFKKKFSLALINRIYIFFIYSCIIGMFLSNLPYHDRILLFGWGISPILIITSIDNFCLKMNSNS